MDYKGYIIEIEKVYNQDYQSDSYRAVVVDNDSYVVKRGTNLFSIQNDAYREGREIIDSIVVDNKFKEYGINYNQKVWTKKEDKLGYSGRVVLFSIAFVLIITLFFTICISLFDNSNLNFGIFLLVLVLFLVAVFIFYKKYLSGYFTTFIFDNGKLYITKFYNENTSTAGAISALGFEGIATAVALRGNEINIDYQKNMKNISDARKVKNKKSVSIWTIDHVIEVRKINKDNYKITIDYYKGESNKKKRKTIHLKNEYNDFYALINCLNMLNNL